MLSPRGEIFGPDKIFLLVNIKRIIFFELTFCRGISCHKSRSLFRVVPEIPDVELFFIFAAGCEDCLELWRIVVEPPVAEEQPGGPDGAVRNVAAENVERSDQQEAAG